MRRPDRVLVGCLILLPVSLASLSVARAQEGLRPLQMIKLQEQLEIGLRARLPAEFDYLEEVIAKVNNRELSEVLVRSTFVYARDKRPYPIQYFNQALRIRARKLGIINVPVLKVDVQQATDRRIGARPFTR